MHNPQSYNARLFFIFHYKACFCGTIIHIYNEFFKPITLISLEDYVVYYYKKRVPFLA